MFKSSSAGRGFVRFRLLAYLGRLVCLIWFRSLGIFRVLRSVECVLGLQCLVIRVFRMFSVFRLLRVFRIFRLCRMSKF